VLFLPEEKHCFIIYVNKTEEALPGKVRWAERGTETTPNCFPVDFHLIPDKDQLREMRSSANLTKVSIFMSQGEILFIWTLSTSILCETHKLWQQQAASSAPQFRVWVFVLRSVNPWSFDGDTGSDVGVISGSLWSEMLFASSAANS